MRPVQQIRETKRTAIKAIRYLRAKFGTLFVQHAMSCARAIDECEADSERRATFHTCLEDFRDECGVLACEALKMFTDIVLSSQPLLISQEIDPCKWPEHMTTVWVIEPSLVGTNALLRWVLGCMRVPGLAMVPLLPKERLPVKTPVWLFPEDQSSFLDDETFGQIEEDNTEARVKLALSFANFEAKSLIGIARLSNLKPIHDAAAEAQHRQEAEHARIQAEQERGAARGRRGRKKKKEALADEAAQQIPTRESRTRTDIVITEKHKESAQGKILAYIAYTAKNSEERFFKQYEYLLDSPDYKIVPANSYKLTSHEAGALMSHKITTSTSACKALKGARIKEGGSNYYATYDMIKVIEKRGLLRFIPRKKSSIGAPHKE